jgi:hypothetical protein
VSCSDVRVALGAFVLGALDPAERAEVDVHLVRCPACRDELAHLAGLPGLLGRLTVDEVVAGPVRPDPALLERLLASVAHRRRARRRLLVATVAAALALVGAGGTAVGVLHREAPHLRVLSAESAPVQGAVVHASFGLLARPWGTELTLQLRGVRRGERCRLVAVARDGRSEVAASWQASYAGRADVTGATSIAAVDLDSLRVVTGTGQELIATSVPR